MTLQNLFHEIQKNIMIEEYGLEDRILALHESATKLWQAAANNRTDELLYMRSVNALISVLAIMDSIGIEDVEEYISNRVAQLKSINQF